MITVLEPLHRLAVHQMHGSKWWLVLEDYSLHLLIDGKYFEILIRAGFRYDRSSIPEWVPNWIVSKDDLGCHAPLVHDVLYFYNGKLDGGAVCMPPRTFTRAEANELFRLVMQADKVKSSKATAAYLAVKWLSRRW